MNIIHFRNILGHLPAIIAPPGHCDNDNLAIALCTYYTGHKPENDPEDETGWSDWVRAQCDAMLDRIAVGMIEALNKQAVPESADYEHGCALCGKEVLPEHDLHPHICDGCNLREGIAKLRAERDHAVEQAVAAMQAVQQMGQMKVMPAITDALVDRMAAAAWDTKATRKWSEIPEDWKPFYREQMRAALEVMKP